MNVFWRCDTQHRWTVSLALLARPRPSREAVWPSYHCKGPGLTFPFAQALTLNFSFLAHTMGLIRVPNSCVTEKISHLEQRSAQSMAPVGALWGSEGAAA